MSSFEARVDQLEKENIAEDQKRSSQEEDDFRLSQEPEKETLRIVVQQSLATPVAALPRSLDHETREEMLKLHSTLVASDTQIKEREATKQPNIGEELLDLAVVPDSAIVPDPAVLPLLD